MTTPAMTKKHFVFLADSLAEARSGMSTMHGMDPDEVLDFTIDVLILRLSATNTQFDRARFMDACGYGQRVLDLTPEQVQRQLLDN